MQVLRLASAALAVLLLAGAPTGAETAAGPSELPPADFSGNQYVDRAGCVFMRTDVDGQTAWLPRTDRERKPLCGYPPSLTAAEIAAAAEAGTATAPADEAADAAPETGPETAAVAAPAAVSEAPQVAVKKKKHRRHVAHGPAAVRLISLRQIGRDGTDCPAYGGKVQRFLLSDGRRVTRCDDTPVGEVAAYLNGLGVPGLTVAPGAPTAAEIRRAEEANLGAYRVIWRSSGIEVAEPAEAHYVQLGVYAAAGSASRVLADLETRGLPAATVAEKLRGRPVTTVLAGPFTSRDQARAALKSLRRTGYHDAFIRR